METRKLETKMISDVKSRTANGCSLDMNTPIVKLNFPELTPKNDVAIDLVVSVVNKAQDKLGLRQNLFQLANSRNIFGGRALCTTTALKAPLAANSEVLIAELIEKKWQLTNFFSYHIKYVEMTDDESTSYFYFETIFCQLSTKYPIPQVTVKVFFRVADKNTEPPEKKSMPLVIFRIEGQHMEHDVRYVKLSEDWILAMMKMKLIYFKRIENYNKF